MESIMIGVMIVLMGVMMVFGGHRLMMGSHGSKEHAAEQKTPASVVVTNAVTNAPAPQAHHQDSPALRKPD